MIDNDTFNYPSTDVPESSVSNNNLTLDYDYNEERRRFAQIGHEYLIQQLTGYNNTNLNN
jgi:hypothetical protein